MTALAALNSQAEEVVQKVENEEVKVTQETPNEQPDSPG